MPLKVLSCCTYSTAYRTRTQEQWAALQFVRAIKGKPIKGYVHVPLPGGERAHLDAGSAAQTVRWFGIIASTRIAWRGDRPIALVPIPDARCALHTAAIPRARGLAEALAASLPQGKACVLDVLRWAEVMPRAHASGGTRDPQELYSGLRLTTRTLPADGRDVILIDDVIASGGHLRAAAAFLVDCGARVLGAVCAGRADDTDAADADPFRVRTDVLPDFFPDPGWLLPMADGFAF